MSDWRASSLGETVELQRGHDLPSNSRNAGGVPVIGSFGVTGHHDEAKYPGPGVAIGRSGASIGHATYVADDYWPLNTCLFVKDFKGNDPRWVYRLLDMTDFAAFNSGSAQPSLNRNFLRSIPVSIPPLDEQQAIAEVLGAVDDKIVGNSRLGAAAFELSKTIFDAAVEGRPVQPMSRILRPILGGTPSRANPDFWDGSRLWISAKDVTSAPCGVVIDTDERITDDAVRNTKAKPLGAGSVIITARGTVGAVARLAEPASFNQSCYGFEPGVITQSVLYFGILRATERAKAFAHGSVFDTITMRTFDHLDFPELSSSSGSELEQKLAPILETIVACVRETRNLRSMREALLPNLMSGKLRVRHAVKNVETAI